MIYLPKIPRFGSSSLRRRVTTLPRREVFSICTLQRFALILTHLALSVHVPIRKACISGDAPTMGAVQFLCNLL